MDANRTILDANIQEPGELPKLYSRQAIRAFAFFCSTAFGGVLLMQNLRDVGKRKDGNQVLLFSIAYTLLTLYIVNNLARTTGSLAFLLNLAGATILSEFVFKKYFPDADAYPKKKVWKPLIVAACIIIPLVLVQFFA